MNKVILMGRLTRDAELRHTQSGVAVANFTLAIDRSFVGADGIKVDFIDIVVWQKQAESIIKYSGKGLRVMLEGRLQIRSYEAKDGTMRKVAEVVADRVRYLDWREDDSQVQPQEFSVEFDAEDDDDDLPF